MPTLGPRLVIAGTHSGVGKTTVATGVMAALARRGVSVAPAKVGPDFIDPGYHALAAGRPGCSLDAWLSGEELLAPLAADVAGGADVLIVEGVMGLFDGSAQPRCDGSTAAVARILTAPVVLVVDAGAMSGSVAAIVHGYRSLDPRLDLAGVVLNRVGSPGHEALLREALAPLAVDVLGVLYHDDGLAWRERHLGLVPVAEDPAGVRSSLDRLAAIVEQRCDLGAMVAAARRAPPVVTGEPPRARPVGSIRLALASGPAFSFTYPENLRLFQDAGAELAPFDPVLDPALPDHCEALYAGGGFPEVFAPALAGNTALLEDVRRAAEGGVVTWAECGGLLWLSRALDGIPMAGVIPAQAAMTGELTIGYREATTRCASPLGSAGTVLRGHEFHRSTLQPPGEALELAGRFGRGQGGYASPVLFASYLHQHLAATPGVVERFVAAAARSPGGPPSVSRSLHRDPLAG